MTTDTKSDEFDADKAKENAPAEEVAPADDAKFKDASDGGFKYLSVSDVDAEYEGTRTSDWDDKQRSWSNQLTDGVKDDNSKGSAVPHVFDAGEPGQVFKAHELPSVEAMKAAGIDPVNWLAGLPVEDSGDKKPAKASK